MSYGLTWRSKVFERLVGDEPKKRVNFPDVGQLTEKLMFIGP